MRAAMRPAAVRIGMAVPLIAAILAGCQAADGPGSLGDARAARPTLAAPPEATRPAPPPIPAAQALFSFEAMLGIPTNKADVLARGLGGYARARSLTLVRRGDPTASYRVMGFLSAVGGTGDTTVTYVWDIVDASGRRVHRISGMEMAGEADADPWSGVSDEVLTAVAARTIDAIHAWISQAPGGTAPPSPSAAAPPPEQAI